MSILRKIMTAVRGGAREVGELVVDANGTRIFEQEIQDAKTHLNKAKHDLTDVMAKQMQAGRKVESLKKEVEEHEGYAGQALEKGNEELALEIAEKIATLEADLTEQEEVHKSFSTHANRLKDLVKKTERQIKEYERQLTMVKTTESVQKASAAITDNFSSSSSRILSAKDSLDRIKKRQQDNFDRLSAAEDLEAENSEKGLQDKMNAAGIGETATTASSVLDRIKAKKGG
ncbi:MAG: PspA/IM30 family protein [Pseudomonadales bacterium]|jgi:phage shock protein A|nr:PspA/IM30 family protein [Pseudomonadales bacterium]|tara:strand:+ start:1016 stop:1708 length:693 start_codon:yes stop_codon:yes gene_type:complete